MWLDGNTLTYETKVAWEDFADEDNTAGKEGLGFNFCLVWSIGEGQDYVHIQLAEGCTGNGKHAENFAQVTLGPAPAASAAAAPAAASGDAPTLLWDFNEDETISADMGANSNNAVSFWGEKDDAGNDYYVFVAGGNDPYVSVDLEAEDVSDIVWAKARVKNPGPATAIELFGHTNGRGLAGSECTHINVAQDNEWHTYIIYIPEENVKTVNAYKDPQYAIKEPYWEGTVEWIRLDPMWQEGNDGSDAGGSMSSGDEIYIDYIAFFPTEEAAKAFRADQDSAADVAGTPTVSNGTPTYNVNYSIPKAPAAPTLDGVKSAGEWDSALIMRVNNNSTHVIGACETAPDATFYYYWTEEGLYLFANVIDSTEPFTIHDPGAGSYNSGDGVQLNIYPDPEISGSTAGMIYFWSLVVNSEGTASVGEHFVFSDGATGADVPDVQAACTKDGTNYTIEAFFPASVWTESDPPLEFKEGVTFGMTNVVMEEDEGVQDLIVDSAWFNENNEINTYTFVGAEAAAPAEEAPAEPTYTYPASGTEGNAITGTVIGNATGWGDNADAGAAAAFDGNPATFFDPLGVGDGFCGIDAGESYILDKVVILSREGWNDRFPGAMIQGSNDGENWTTLWTSDTTGTNPDYYTVTEFENNTGYSQFRYFNETNHGDVAEVEFYGNPGKVEEAPAEEAPAVENYALGARVIVTSTETDDFPGELAVDGNKETRWASAYNDGEEITIDLGKAKAVNYIALYWETAMASDYVVYGSTDPNDFYQNELASVSGNTENENVLEFGTTPAQYITIQCTKRATEWGNSLYEVVVSGEGDASVDQTLDQKAEAPNTFDFGVIAAVASVISLAGFAAAKKRH